MNFADLLTQIDSSPELNASQARAAKRMARAVQTAAQSTLEGDEPTYEFTASRAGRFAAFSVRGEGRLTSGHASAVLGPRGGLSHVTTRASYQSGGAAFFPRLR